MDVRNEWIADIKTLLVSGGNDAVTLKETWLLLVYTLAAVAALIAYIAGARLRPAVRTVVALLIFLVPAVGLTAWVFVLGDRAPPDAVSVEFENAAAPCVTEEMLREGKASEDEIRQFQKNEAEASAAAACG